MATQKENLVDWLKSQSIRGCLAGSYTLDDFNGADVDVFCYDETAFRNLVFELYYNNMFIILDPHEQDKWNDYYRDQNKTSLKSIGLCTIKFKYNLSVDLNVTLKLGCKTVHDVLYSFDMNFLCQGYCLHFKKEVPNIAGYKGDGIVELNPWNKYTVDHTLWTCKNFLRQLPRSIKYHKRQGKIYGNEPGQIEINTDKVVLGYIGIIDKILDFKSTYKSEAFNENLTNYKADLELVKVVCNEWLLTHIMTDEQLAEIEKTIQSFYGK